MPYFCAVTALAIASAACADHAHDQRTASSQDGTQISAGWVEDTWIFFHNSPNYNLALLEAPATIENRCLKIGAAVVLWSEEHAPGIAELVRAAKAGERPLIRVGGGAILREWVGDEAFPAEVLEKCPETQMVWGAAPPSAFELP